jgi:hypothetical protein
MKNHRVMCFPFVLWWTAVVVVVVVHKQDLLAVFSNKKHQRSGKIIK